MSLHSSTDKHKAPRALSDSLAEKKLSPRITHSVSSPRRRPVNGRLKPVNTDKKEENKTNHFEKSFPLNRQGTSILPIPNFWERRLQVNGQGTVIITKHTSKPFLISVEDERGHYRLALKVDRDQVSFLKCVGDQEDELLSLHKKGCGLEDFNISYWFSYDRDNLVLKYGKGYQMEETTILVHDFLKASKPHQVKKIRENLYPFFNAEDKKYVRKYELIAFPTQDRNPGSRKEIIEFEKDPFTLNLSPLVMDSSKVNLFYLDEGKHIFSASLPAACKELYENIKECCLNYSHDVTGVLMSDAIRHSIQTKGCLLYEKLREKADGFGKKDIKGTYLRITLGKRSGKSPGIPYVLEIWPKGHYSPIHNHGNANAIIKVLFGSINVLIYNKHICSPDSKPLKEFVAGTNDVTWINRNWFQTHKLINRSNDFCATLQCYKYDPDDNIRWPFFDYVSSNETMAEFLPDSDFGFREMHDQIIKEYKFHSFK